jgi:hypothetical protein
MPKLTDAFIRNLQVPEDAKDVQAFDDNCHGFGVSKQKSGHTTLFVKYSVGTQQRRKTLGLFVCGTLDRIRKEATLVLAKAKLGTDVVGEAKKARQEAEQAKTLGELVPIYLALREKGDDYWSKLRPRSLTEVTRYLTKAWLPLHGEPIDKITRQMVRSRRDENRVSERRRLGQPRACSARHVLRMGDRPRAPHRRQSEDRHQTAEAGQAHAGPKRGRAGRDLVGLPGR